MRNRKEQVPQWLQHLQEEIGSKSKAASKLAIWQEKLWKHIRLLQSSPLILQDRLYYPVPVGRSAVISTRDKKIRCGLSRPVVSSRGTHGLHLFLIDESNSEKTAALLLTPATFDRLQARPRRYPHIRPYSLADSLVVLKTTNLRGEFHIRDIVYRQEIPEQDLLQTLALEVSVWRNSQDGE